MDRQGETLEVENKQDLTTKKLGNKLYILFLFLVMMCRLYVFNLVMVNGDSMLPNLHGGDFLIVSRLADPKREDVVVFKEKESGKNLVKRLIGLEGDTVEYRDGSLILNGEDIDEDYIEFKSKEDFLVKGEIPEGKAFVLGDNRVNSRDSRSFGLVDVDDLDVVKFRYYPFDRIGGIK